MSKAHIVIAIAVFFACAGLVFFALYARYDTYVKNQPIALRLAKEGIDALQKIRSDNRSKFAQSKECWNTKPDSAAVTAQTCALKTNKIGQENFSSAVFRVTQNPQTLQFRFSEGAEILPNPTDENYRLLYDKGANRYFLPPDLTNSDESAFSVSPFYRQITIRYLDYDGNPKTAEGMNVLSTVYYKNGSRIENVKLAALLMKL